VLFLSYSELFVKSGPYLAILIEYGSVIHLERPTDTHTHTMTIARASIASRSKNFEDSLTELIEGSHLVLMTNYVSHIT